MGTERFWLEDDANCTCKVLTRDLLLSLGGGGGRREGLVE